MTKKDLSSWSGFGFPVRLITEDERELLTPQCEECSLTAVIVEAQHALDAKAAKRKLIDFPNEALKFYCANHSPVDLPDDFFAEADFDFFMKMRRQVMCPRYDHLKFIITCLRNQPACIRRCAPIKNAIGKMSFDLAQARTIRGHKTYMEQKEREKTDAKARQEEDQDP